MKDTEAGLKQKVLCMLENKNYVNKGLRDPGLWEKTMGKKSAGSVTLPTSIKDTRLGPWDGKFLSPLGPEQQNPLTNAV
jgi:hypothetical protein